ncbi:MAG: sensor histidine kinase [Bacteroidetes bacterium]|nr:sensor histidine kinase [Bacteroidota bacterium]
MKHFVFYIILLACFTANSQSLGPLLKEFKTAKEDTNKVLLMLEIGYVYELDDKLDSATYYYKQCETLSKKINYNIGLLKYFSYYSAILNLQEKNEEGLELNLKGVELAKKINNRFQLACAYSNTGASYYQLYMYDKTIEYFLKAAEYFEKENNKKYLGQLYGNLAGTYSEIEEQSKKGYYYGLKSLEICRELNDTIGIEGALANTAGILMSLKRYDSALVLVKEEYKISQISKHKRSMMTSLVNMNFLFMRLKRYEDIKKCAEELLAVSTEIDDKEGMAGGLQYIGKYYFQMKKYNEGKPYILKAIAITQEYKIMRTLSHCYSALSNIELALGNLPEFHLYGARADSINDVLITQKIDRNIHENEAKYSLQKKQDQIETLNKENEIKQLNLKQKSLLNLMLTAAILIFILLGFLYYRNTKQKRKLLLSEAQLQQQRIQELETEKKLLVSESMIKGQEEERKRLAKDLHDGLGGILSSAKYSFSNMKNNLIISEENASAFENGLSILDKSIRELRRVAHNMMPEALVKFGLNTALKDFCESINKNSSLQLTYQSYDFKDEDVSQNKISTIYRIIQELVNNIIKHAEAKTALVQFVKTNDTLSITVEDDGKGFEIVILRNNSGIGYLNLYSRVAYINGKIDIQTAPGKGTSVNIEIPNISHD